MPGCLRIGRSLGWKCTRKCDAFKSGKTKVFHKLQAKAAEPEKEPAKTTQGDAVAEEAPKTEANGSATATEPEPATAAGVEAGKTKEHEEPKAAAEGEKVAHSGIGEAKPVGEAE